VRLHGIVSSSGRSTRIDQTSRVGRGFGDINFSDEFCCGFDIFVVHIQMKTGLLMLCPH
jgi:hypothetical protein